MLASIKETRRGNLSQKVAVTGCLEVNELSTEYNFMLDKINSYSFRKSAAATKWITLLMLILKSKVSRLPN